MALLYVVPGNPGKTEYYETFIKDLKATGHFSEIFINEHKGHSHNRLRLFNIQQQIEYHFNEISKILTDSTTKKHPLILLGHSIGAYISFEIIKRLAPEYSSRVFVIAIFPFLQTGHLQKRWRYTLFGSLFFRELLAAVISVVFFSRTKKAEYFLSQYPHYSLNEARHLTQNSGFLFLRQIAYLAKTEISTLPAAVESIDLPDISQTVFLFTEGDKWASSKLPDYLKTKGFNVELFLNSAKELSISEPGFDHDFIMHREQCKRMTQKIISLF